MKIQIIPDIHNKYGLAEQMIDKEQPDQVVFLGDYFDDFYDSYQEADNTATWLVNSLEKKNRTHLIGNHDLSYMTDNPKLKCSGWTQQKHSSIKRHEIDWKRLQLYHWIDDIWLCTHAGLSYTFYTQITEAGTPSNVMEFSEYDLKKIDDVNYNHKYFQAGEARGGSAKIGGILWCDYNEEFKPIPDLKQIFGHTPLSEPSRVENKDMCSENICLDAGLRYYALYENGEMQIKKL